MDAYDVAILGAGISGLTATYFSLEEGFSTILIDRNIPGRGGSYNSVGIITRQLFTKREILLAIDSINILSEIVPNIDVYTYDRRFITIEDEKTAFQDYRFYRKIFTDVDIYYYGELPRELSNINLYANEAVLLTYEDLMVDTRGVIDAIYNQVRDRNGLKVFEGYASKLENAGDNYIVRVEDGRSIEARNVILAMGAWNKYFLEKSKVYLPVSTYACIAARFKIDGVIPISGSDEVNYLYWITERNNTLSAGEYYQSTPITRPDKVKDIRLEGREKSIVKSLVDRFKGLKVVELKEFIVGSCSFPLGKRPLFKEIMKNVFLIDGLGGYGFTLGPALAKEAIDSITSRL